MGNLLLERSILGGGGFTNIALVGLTCRHERDAKVSKRKNKFSNEILDDVRVNRMSSANKEIL